MPADGEPTIGLKLMGGLPDDDGLSPRAAELDEARSTLVYGVVMLRAHSVTDRVETDSATVSMRIVQIEASGLTKDEATTIKRILADAQARRTGSRAMVRGDGEVDPAATSDDGEGAGAPPAAFSDEKPKPAKATKAVKAPAKLAAVENA